MALCYNNPQDGTGRYFMDQKALQSPQTQQSSQEAKLLGEQLIQAIADRETKLAIQLIKQGADLTVMQGHLTLLDLAVAYENLDLVVALRNAGMDINAIGGTGQTALGLACSQKSSHFVKGQEEVLDWLIKNTDLNMRDKLGNTALHIMVQKSNEKGVLKLIESGAQVDIQNNDGETPLSRAASNGSTKVVELLLERGANPNIQNNRGQTPLMRAAGRGYVDIMTFLTEKGADLEARDNDGETALMIAAGWGGQEAVQFLLEKGASLEDRDKYGLTPLCHAASHVRMKTVERLIKEGADVFVQTKSQSTILMLAITNCEGKNVNPIIKCGVDVNHQNVSGQTALMIAAEEGYENIIRSLTAEKAEPDLCDETGKTALMYAAENKYPASVDALIEAHADVNLQDKEGETALIKVLKGYEKLSDKYGGDVIALDRKRYMNVIIPLVEAHTQLDLRDKEGKTVFDYMDRIKDEELMSRLVQEKMEQDLLKRSDRIPYEELVDSTKNQKIFETLLKLNVLSHVFESTSIDSYDKLKKVYQEVIPYAQENPSLKKQIQNTFVKAQNRLRFLNDPAGK